MKRALPLLILLILSVVSGACGSDSVAAGTIADEVEAIPFASTKMLTTSDLSSLHPDTEDGNLVFDHAPAQLADAAPGTIMIAGVSAATPHGFMRVVTDVQRAGDVLTLKTMGAPPQLAFQKLHARLSRPVSLDNAEPLMNTLEPLGIGGTSERQVPVNVVLFDGDGNKDTTDDQLRIEGSYQGALTYDLSLDVDWGAVTELPSVVKDCIASAIKIVVGEKPKCNPEDLIPEVKVKFTVDPAVASDLHLVGGASLGFEKEFDIASVSLAPLVLGPIVFLPRLEVIAKVEGGASATFKAGVSADMTITTSVAVSSKSAGNPTFSPPAIKDKNFHVDPPEVGLQAHAQANAGVRFVMPLYGTIGPYATAEATIAIEADPSRTPCWTLRAGLESVIGVKITTPALPFLGHVDLVDWKTSPFKAIDEEVASGNCIDPPPGVSHLPPGSGPDAPALRDPAFTPWSHVEQGAADATAASGPEVTGVVFSDLQRAIDGRWLVAGSDSTSLVKIDDTGKPIWTAAYAGGDASTGMRILRTVPRKDASIVALASGVGGAAFTIVNLGQSGAVRSARSYSLPLEVCATPKANVLAADAASGFLVMGLCQSQGKSFLVHLDELGNVQDAHLWTADGFGTIAPNAFTRTTTNQLVLTGQLAGTNGSDGMFVTRLDEAGNIAASDSYYACDAGSNLTPTSLLPAESNGLTVAGGSFAQSRAFVARLFENGEVGFVTYPGIKDGHAPVFVTSAIAELPTSGFVMTASTVELTGEPGVTTIPGVAVMGLDAQGHSSWAKRYALVGNASSYSALRLTTDGGALVTSYGGPVDNSSGVTWTMKVFAKDGTLADRAVSATPFTADDGATDCALRRAAFAPAVSDLAVQVALFNVTRR